MLNEYFEGAQLRPELIGYALRLAQKRYNEAFPSKDITIGQELNKVAGLLLELDENENSNSMDAFITVNISISVLISALRGIIDEVNSEYEDYVRNKTDEDLNGRLN